MTTESETAPEEISTRTTWLILGVATIVAMTPHFFFAPPVQMHMEGMLQGWLGISVWAPAILAGVALFFGVEFSDRLESADERVDTATRAGLAVVLVIAYIVFAAAANTTHWTNMSGMHPWDELKKALPLYAALGALQALFWQGFAQHRALRDFAPTLRAGTVTLLSTAIALPFFLEGNPDVVERLLPLVFAESLVAAIVFESGFTVRATMVVRAICGAAFIWFQQTYFL